MPFGLQKQLFTLIPIYNTCMVLGRKERAMKKDIRETIRRSYDYEENNDWKKHDSLPHVHKPEEKRPKYPEDLEDTLEPLDSVEDD